MSVMKKAKMSTDKALLKEVIQNLSVELQPETAGEFTLEHFKTEVDKAGGARYAGNSTAENKHSLMLFILLCFTHTLFTLSLTLSSLLS